MPENDKPRRPKSPAWMEHARQFYGAAFEVNDAAELSGAIRDFAELSDAEQRFTLAHLLYLNLQAQTQGARLLRELRDTLDEVADDVRDGVDGLGDEEEDGGDDEAAEPDIQAAAQTPPVQA